MKVFLNYLKVIIFIMILSMVFYFAAGKELKYSTVEIKSPEREHILPEISTQTTIEQSIYMAVDEIESISIWPFMHGKAGEGTFGLQLLDKNKEIVANFQLEESGCNDGTPYIIDFDTPLLVQKNAFYTLRLELYGEDEVDPTFYYSSIGGKQYLPEENVKVNDTEFNGYLCMGISGLKHEIFGLYYWYFVAAFIFLVVCYMIWSKHQGHKGKFTAGMLFLTIWGKYEFLIKQLVARDFKVKYKRSVLGYCWSFLNPLLTMLVQYVVFSTIFKTGIENYPVYLLSGNIIFSFFTDAVGQGLMSIIGNASLITKVYVPKYIYPATKVMSCSINLFISLLPLLLVTLMTGGKVNITLLLLPYALACLLVFCMGMVLLLSAANVFFRDVQYLWGIISLVWMYATPLFYPADIIPENLRFIQTLNPMYHIITFVRSILIEGISPAPGCYLYCFIGAMLTFVIGAGVFKKTQGKFVLYI